MLPNVNITKRNITKHACATHRTFCLLERYSTCWWKIQERKMTQMRQNRTIFRKIRLFWRATFTVANEQKIIYFLRSKFLLFLFFIFYSILFYSILKLFLSFVLKWAGSRTWSRNLYCNRNSHQQVTSRQNLKKFKQIINHDIFTNTMISKKFKNIGAD
jgi:hypothetical protein